MQEWRLELLEVGYVTIQLYLLETFIKYPISNFYDSNPIIQYLEYYAVDVIHPSMQSSPPWSRLLHVLRLALDAWKMFSPVVVYW